MNKRKLIVFFNVGPTITRLYRTTTSSPFPHPRGWLGCITTEKASPGFAAIHISSKKLDVLWLRGVLMHKLNSSHQLAAQQQEIEHVLKSKVCPIQKHCAPCWTSPWLCWSISENFQILSSCHDGCYTVCCSRANGAKAQNTSQVKVWAGLPDTQHFKSAFKVSVVPKSYHGMILQS